ncbi:MAG: hypothetical protein OJJ21_05630 [Ferrovibrio sp.]|uniref:hypothetical protein n=1 Tax=Ferrovibrio sp. TaxID=1917215 RepID=UPI00262147E4|nr:hypothetical protein [Ferrovibrio sp.]MCW0233061.1 hypothetical protein [Ferrovibrio sp.]
MTYHARIAATSTRRLPDQITLQHGPRPELGQFFLTADKAARDRGVTLSLNADFDYLRIVNNANKDSWDSLAPSFNNAFNAIDERNGFCIIGRNEAGDVVSTQAARVYDLTGSSLADCVSSFRFFYADPDKMCEAGETCSFTSPSAAKLSGRIVFSGSTWIHPDYRKRGLPAILPRISRALALTKWNTDYTISFVKFILVEKGVAKAYGYSNVEPALEWRAPDGRMRYQGALIWMNRGELLADMQRFPALIAPSDADAPSLPREQGENRPSLN